MIHQIKDICFGNRNMTFNFMLNHVLQSYDQFPASIDLFVCLCVDEDVLLLTTAGLVVGGMVSYVGSYLAPRTATETPATVDGR